MEITLCDSAGAGNAVIAVAGGAAVTVAGNAVVAAVGAAAGAVAAAEKDAGHSSLCIPYLSAKIKQVPLNVEQQQQFGRLTKFKLRLTNER